MEGFFIVYYFPVNKLVRNGIADASRKGRPLPSCLRAILLLDNGVFLLLIRFRRTLEQFLWICFLKQFFFLVLKFKSVLITLNTHSHKSLMTPSSAFFINFEKSFELIFLMRLKIFTVPALIILTLVSCLLLDRNE